LQSRTRFLNLSRRGYPDPSSSSLDQDDDLAEDCFIAQIDSDIFDSVSENAAKIRKTDSDRREYSVIMRPSSLGGGRILRCTLSVRLSVRPVIERHVAPPSELQ